MVESVMATSDSGAGRDGRWAVPLRRVFPWWYLGGAVATFAALVVLEQEGSTAFVAFWGPATGLAIQDRQRAARDRADRGLSLDRRSLVGPPWREPLYTALLTAFAVGAGLLVHAIFGGWSGTAALGAGLLLASAAAGAALVLVARARHRRRPTGPQS
ncbi:hypothetical protein BIU97_01675 [Curtobacterium sp. MCBA15_009]|nr:hypothetical protein BIU92_15045 [Curtobacterium sp. MCBA15_003]OII14194.1 hypothetical protein BIU97_01675 [Curtobacterium sp. MCBA15_009]OII32914.1 hypothetical protein BIU94_15365 [Curtobacterium sp. MMLR14_006]